MNSTTPIKLFATEIGDLEARIQTLENEVDSLKMQREVLLDQRAELVKENKQLSDELHKLKTHFKLMPKSAEESHAFLDSPTFLANTDAHEEYLWSVVDLACDDLSVTKEQLLSDSRKQPLPMARHTVWCVLRETSSISVADMARYFGRHHSTIVKSIAAAQNKKDPEFIEAKQDLLKQAIRLIPNLKNGNSQ